MILGASDIRTSAATLDDLFRRAGVRHPDMLALSDPPNRETFSDGPARALTYAEADRMISAFAARLRNLGLHTDSVVAIQLPNTVDGVIALLGTLRAGMIAALLPLLWRQQDIADALRGVGCRAIITCARAGRHKPVESAVRAAAELFPIRHVCAFGRELPDGVVPLDNIDAAETAPAQVETRGGAAAAHVAVLTFEITDQRVVAVPRNHAQLGAGGLAVYAEAGLSEDASLLSTISPTSFAGLSVGVMPWLLAGGTLTFHHGCDPDVLAQQCGALGDASIILPGPAVNAMADANLFGPSINPIIGLWRAPERLEACAPWSGSRALVDVAAFGEIGLVAAHRGPHGTPAAVPDGAVYSPRGVAGISLVETSRSKFGTLKLRGPMVSTHTFPSEPRPADGHQADAAGFMDTGYSCRGANGWVITAPPPGIASIGGYRVSRSAFEATVTKADPQATILAVPDGLLGERLAGAAANAPALIAAIEAAGANPLISGAFRLRGEEAAA